MPTPVIMPKFGMSQEEGTILRWLKHEGDIVEKGETLLEVQTDKVDMEVESPAQGVLRDIQFGAETTLPVTTVIAQIYAAHEIADSPTGAPRSPAALSHPPIARATPLAQRIASDTGIDLRQVSGTGPAGRILKSDVELAALSATLSKAALSAQSSPQNSSHSRTGKVRATPAARRLARDDQVDLGRIEGSGPKARIQASDIAAFLNAPTQSEQPQSEAAQQSSSPTLSSTVSFAALPAASAVLRGRRKTIAKRLSQSWQQAPHVTFTMSIDMSQAEALRRQLADDVEQTGGKLTPTVVIAKAVAAALQRHPHLNAWLSQEGQELVLSEQPAVNLGIAVALADGLIVPVVRNAETLGLAALARRIVELAQRARSEQLTPEQVQGATFTLSNLGMYPLDHFTAIINPPQVAILSVARIQLQPVWDGSAFQAKPILQVTLSADHRALDGASAAAFLSEVKRLLEQPARLLL